MAQNNYSELYENLYGDERKPQGKATADYLTNRSNLLEEDYIRGLSQAKQSREGAIAQAYKDYMRATSPYGVAAERLANLGIDRASGYGAILQSRAATDKSNATTSAYARYDENISDLERQRRAGQTEIQGSWADFLAQEDTRLESIQAQEEQKQLQKREILADINFRLKQGNIGLDELAYERDRGAITEDEYTGYVKQYRDSVYKTLLSGFDDIGTTRDSDGETITIDMVKESIKYALDNEQITKEHYNELLQKAKRLEEKAKKPDKDVISRSDIARSDIPDTSKKGWDWIWESIIKTGQNRGRY